MMNHMPHPVTRPTCKKHIGGSLPKEIPVPEYFSDPTHRSKCVTEAFFELAKSVKGIAKLDTLRLKKYYSYYIKMNRNNILRI